MKRWGQVSWDQLTEVQLVQLRSPDTSHNECVLIASEEREDTESRYLKKEVKTEEGKNTS